MKHSAIIDLMLFVGAVLAASTPIWLGHLGPKEVVVFPGEEAVLVRPGEPADQHDGVILEIKAFGRGQYFAKYVEQLPDGTYGLVRGAYLLAPWADVGWPIHCEGVHVLSTPGVYNPSVGCIERVYPHDHDGKPQLKGFVAAK